MRRILFTAFFGLFLLEIHAAHAQGDKEAKPEIKDVQLDGALDYLREQVRMMAKLPPKKNDKQ